MEYVSAFSLMSTLCVLACCVVGSRKVVKRNPFVPNDLFMVPDWPKAWVCNTIRARISSLFLLSEEPEGSCLQEDKVRIMIDSFNCVQAGTELPNQTAGRVYSEPVE